VILQGNDPHRSASFSLGHRLRRQLWNMVYVVLFRTSPRPFHAWRAFLLRLFGARFEELWIDLKLDRTHNGLAQYRIHAKEELPAH